MKKGLKNTTRSLNPSSTRPEVSRGRARLGPGGIPLDWHRVEPVQRLQVGEVSVPGNVGSRSLPLYQARGSRKSS